MLDALDEKLAQKRQKARQALIAEGQRPACRCCGHELDRSTWRTAHEVVKSVYGRREWDYGDSSTIHLALRDLVVEGIYEADPDSLKVRLAVSA